MSGSGIRCTAAESYGICAYLLVYEVVGGVVEGHSAEFQNCF